MTLRLKTSLLLAATVVGVLLAAGAYHLQHLEATLRRSVFSALESVADTTAASIATFLEDTQRDVAALAQALPEEVLRSRDPAAAQAVLREMLEIHPKFANGVFVLDPDGVLWVDHPAHPGLWNTSFEFREYFHSTLERRAGVVATPYRSQRTGQPVLTFTAYLGDSQGRPLGVLGCSIPLLSPAALGGIRATRIGDTGYLYVYDRSRLMILHPKDERVLARDVPVGANRLFDAAIEGFAGSGETVNSRGVEMLVSFRQIPGSDWILGVQQPAAEAFAGSVRLRREILLYTGLAAVFVVGLGAYLVRRITAPLEVLRDAAADLGRRAGSGSTSGDLPPPLKALLDKPRGDEIGDLAVAFKEMAERLEVALGSLNRAVVEWERTFQAVPNLIFVLDPQGAVVRLNRAATAVCGTSPEAARGQPLGELFSVRPVGDGGPALESVLATREEVHQEVVGQGDGRIYSASSLPLVEDGRLLGAVCIARDVTESRWAQAALSASEERFRNMAALLPGIVFETDLEGVLTFINRRAYELTGYTPADVTEGFRALDLLVPEDRERARHTMQRVLAGEPSAGNEYTAMRKDGQRFPVLILSTRIVAEGAPAGLRGIIIDLSRSKSMEARLRQSTKMEAIGQLAGGIAHDFNNLLAPILGYADMVLEELPEEQPAHRDVQQIVVAAERARDLVSQILAFSRQDEEAETVQPAAPLVREGLSLLRASLPASIRIDSQVDDHAGTTLARASDINQILLNLGVNARHALEGRPGTLQVVLEGTCLDAGTAGNLGMTTGPAVCLCVRDDGPGIAPEVRERMFEPFFTTKAVGEGSGMGLAVVHGVVTRLGGAIEVDSAPGAGAIFRVFLPCREPPAVPPGGAAAGAPEAVAAGTVLLVDDEPMVLEFTSQALRRLGWQVEVCGRPSQALERFRADPDAVDLVITDQTMPEQSGLQLAAALSELRPGLPILLCTGFSHSLTPEAVQQAGVARVLSKPVTRRDLVQAIREVLPQRAPAAGSP